MNFDDLMTEIQNRYINRVVVSNNNLILFMNNGDKYTIGPEEENGIIVFNNMSHTRQNIGDFRIVRTITSILDESDYKGGNGDEEAAPLSEYSYVYKWRWYDLKIYDEKERRFLFTWFATYGRETYAIPRIIVTKETKDYGQNDNQLRSDPPAPNNKVIRWLPEENRFVALDVQGNVRIGSTIEEFDR